MRPSERYVPLMPTERVGSIAFSTPIVNSSWYEALMPGSVGSPATEPTWISDARATQPGVGSPVAHFGPTCERSLMSYEKLR